MAVEAGTKIGDLAPVAQLVECVPEPEAEALSVDVSAPAPSPVARAMAATIEQTGADPPPAVSRG